MYRYFLWGKKVGYGIIQNFAVLKLYSTDPIIETITSSDGSSEVLWRFIALRLLKSYPVFPRLWSDDGHLNLFWVNNVIVYEIPEEDIYDWKQSYPIFNV